MAEQGRVQVRELQSDVRLRPAPMQSDTYAPPPRQERDTRMFQLADALSAFSGSIGNAMGTMKPSAEDKQNQEWTAQRKFAGLTREDWNTATESGALPRHANEFEKKAIQAGSGLAWGGKRVDELKQHFMTEFDWDSGSNPEELIAQTIQQDLEKHGADKNWGTNYLREITPIREWVLDFASKRATEQHVKAQHDTAFGVIDTKVDDLIEAGTAPDVIAQQVMFWYKDLGKDGTLGVNPEALDQEVLNKANRIAETHPDVAMAMLGATRKQRNGKEVSLLTNPVHRDAVLSVQSRAFKAKSEMGEKATREMLLAEDVTAFEGGNADAIQDHRYTTLLGEEKVISAKERKDRAHAAFFERSKRTAQQRRETQGETFVRELRVLRNGGEKHPQLAQLLTGIGDMANLSVLEDPEARSKLMQKLDAYSWVQQDSTASLLAYTEEKDREFAETYIMANQYLTHEDGTRYSKDEALAFAVRTTQITKDGMQRVARYRDEMETEIGKLSSEPGWLWGTNDVAPANASIAEQRVSRLAQKFVATGLEPQKAISMAAQSVKKTSVVYRKSLLDLQGHDIPMNFNETMDGIIADIATENPLMLEQEGLTDKDIGVYHWGGGRFSLVDAEDNQTLRGDDGELIFVDLKTIRNRAATIRKAKEDAALRDSVFKSSVLRTGYVEAVDSDGETYWVDPKSRQIMTYEIDEETQAPIWKKTGRRYKRIVITNPSGGFTLGR